MHEWISNSHAERTSHRMLGIIVIVEWGRSLGAGDVYWDRYEKIEKIQRETRRRASSLHALIPQQRPG
jgi:hypothetical protein